MTNQQRKVQLIVDSQEDIDEYIHVCEMLRLTSGQELTARDKLFVKRLIRKKVPYNILLEAAMDLGPAPPGRIMFLYYHRIKRTSERLLNKERAAKILVEIGGLLGKKKIN